MDWPHLLAYITGRVDQELLLRNEYLAAENRILRAKIKGRLLGRTNILTFRGLDKRIDDLNPISNASRLQIFGEQYDAGRLFGSSKHKSVPERESMEAVEIDGSEYVVEIWNDKVEFSQQFNFPASDFGVYVEFAGDGDEIFLKYL
jgi:hypothetical protein